MRRLDCELNDRSLDRLGKYAGICSNVCSNRNCISPRALDFGHHRMRGSFVRFKIYDDLIPLPCRQQRNGTPNRLQELYLAT
jgi:hypothetical protein